MLEPWALRNSRWKKQFAAWAFENENLGSASCLHALCATEVEDFRRRGLKNPIALIPNGIDPAEYAMLPDRSLLEARFPALRGRQWALFLSRIHPKKGLPNLLKAWAKTRKSDDWTLIVAGPDELGHEAEMKRLAAELELGRDICFTGALRGREKLAALGGARLFVLPSLSEGFSMAMLEAAASGLPMLLTPQCNFPELTAAGGAVEALPNAAGCQAGLARLLAMSPSELAAMGARGRRLVHKSYTWAIVAGQMLDVYRWMQGAGPKPECIV
jgi:poly(glycerol-phosphate) alpha-glucosyltransferase